MESIRRFAAASTETVQSDINALNDKVLPKNNLDNSQLQNVLAIVFGIAAAVSVLMIVIAGFRLIAGEGNPDEVSKAKSTILYAIIGLFVSLSSEAIVAFVLTR